MFEQLSCNILGGQLNKYLIRVQSIQTYNGSGLILDKIEISGCMTLIQQIFALNSDQIEKNSDTTLY